MVFFSDDRFRRFSNDAGKTWELYDLLADPGEETHRAEQHPQLVKTMSAQLLASIDACRVDAK